MNNRLPLYIENLELPKENINKEKKSNSYGYVSILYIMSLIISLGSVITIIILGNRWENGR